MSGQAGKELWEFIDANRGVSRPEELIREWVAAGRDHRERRQRLRSWITARGSAIGGQFFSSPDLADFMGQVAAAAACGAGSILDPVCGSGYLLRAAADASGASVIHGVDINPSMSDLARLVLPESAVVFTGDVLADDVPLQSQYDLVVAEPPFGLRVRSPVAIRGVDGNVRGDFTDVLAAWASSRLSERGKAILILPTSFLWARRSELVRQVLGVLGCVVTACVHLPGGSLQGTGVEAYVVIIERYDQGEVFVGQYTKDPAHQRVLVDNLASRKEGRRPAQGRICSWTNFRGYRSIEAEDRIQRLVPRLGFAPVPMGALVIDATRTDRTAFARLQAKPNSVYLPLAGRGKATTSQETLSGRLRNYVQLQLNPDLADARFVAHLLNRELGQAFLDTLRTGTTIEHLRLPDLLNATFYLPPLATQEKVLGALDRIATIRGEIDELEATLWTDTQSVDQIARQVESVNRVDRFDDWLETLPFPLASVLWRYRATSGSAREKYEALVHFFEALAEFVATVHLSAFSSDAEIWSQYKPELRSALEGQSLRIDHGTFGAWKCICEFLGARLRPMIDGALDICTSLYRTHNPQTLRMLSSSELLKVLQQANSVRNNWIGHVGAVGEKQAQKVLAECFNLVQQCRGVSGRAWLDYQLIQPGESRFRDGLFHYKVRLLQGTRSAPFETVERESIEGMDDRALYLLDPSNDRGLRLLPFVRVMPSPRTEANACYFFNRLLGDDRCRYVSYHFSQDAELTNGFDDTRYALEALGLSGLPKGDV